MIRFFPPLAFLLTILVIPSLFAQGLLINRQLSEISTATAGEVETYLISPDEQFIVYRADRDIPGKDQLYSVRNDGVSTPVLLFDPVGPRDDVEEFLISADSSTVVFLADMQNLISGDFTNNLYSVPIGGGTPVQLNSGPDTVRDRFFITPDSQRVIFGTSNDPDIDNRADNSDADQSGRASDESANSRGYGYSGPSFTSLFTVSIGGGALTMLEQLPDGRELSDLTMSPDGSRVAYIANADVEEIFDLFSVDTMGTSPALFLNNLTTDDVRGPILFTPDSQRVIFRHNNDPLDLFSAIAMVESNPTQLNDTPMDSSLDSRFIVTNDSANVVFILRQGYSEESLHVVPVDGSEGPLQLTAPSTLAEIRDFQVTPNNEVVVFTAEQDGGDQFLLFAARLDGTTGVPVQQANIPNADGDVREFEVTPDSSEVLFRGDLLVNEQNDLFATNINAPDNIRQNAPRGSTNPTQLNPTFTDPNSDVDAFEISPDGNTVAFVADPVFGTEQLLTFSSGNGVTNLTPSIVDGGGVRSRADGDNDPSLRFFGNQIAFLGELNLPQVAELFTVPLSGNAGPVRINQNLAIGGFVGEGDYLIAPDSSRVLFTHTISDISKGELFSAVPDDSSSPTLIETGIQPSDSISLQQIASDSSRVVYRIDQDLDDLYGNYRSTRGGSISSPVRPQLIGSANLDGTNVTTLADNSFTSHTFRDIRFTPDNLNITYRRDEESGAGDEIAMTPATGGSTVVLNDHLTTGGDVIDYAITSDSQTMVYRADQEEDNVLRLYSVPVPQSGSSGRNGALSTELTPNVTGSQDVNGFIITPDGQTVVYESDERSTGRDELYSIPVDGSTSSTQLTPDFESFADVGVFQVGPNSTYAVYVADQDESNKEEIYSVPIDGNSPPVKLNPTFDDGRIQRDFKISPDGNFVMFEAEIRESSQARDLFFAPIAGGTPVQLTDSFTTGSIRTFLFSPDSTLIAFMFEEIDESELDRGYGSYGQRTLFVYSITEGRELFGIPSTATEFRLNAFSPDSQLLLTQDNIFPNSREVFLFPIFTAGGKTVSDLGSNTFDPQFTPDGKFVIYQGEQNTEGSNDIYSTQIIRLGNALMVK
jgi:hypothetical protein